MKTSHPFKLYTGFLVITIAALFIIKQLDISYPLTIVTKEAPSSLSVVGEGKVDAVPDLATVQAGISVNGSTVSEVQTKINETNNKIVSSAIKLGIKKEDIKTSNYSINPSYDYNAAGNQITGYSGNATIAIKVKKQNVLSQVIFAATASGANQIFDTQYTVEKPEKYREMAREKAITNAQEQAQKIAKSLGINLGRVINIVESTPSSGPIALSYLKSGIGGIREESATIEPGSQTITSTVTLYFETK